MTRRDYQPVGVDLPAHRPDLPERDLVIAIVKQAWLDSRLGCAKPGRWVCHRADAIDAAGGEYLRDLAAAAGLEHAVEAIGSLPVCCGRTSTHERPPRLRRTAQDALAAERGAEGLARRRNAA